MYLCFTVLYEYIQGLCLAVLGGDPQGCHPVAVSGRHFGPVPKQQHQNGGTPLLLGEDLDVYNVIASDL